MYAPNPAASQMVWEYRLSYASSRSTKRSLLTSVAKCGPSTACLKAKQFTYDDTVLVPAFKPVDVGAAALNVTGTPPPALQVADFDGDGADDVLYRGGGTNQPLVRLGQREGNGAVSPLKKEFPALGPDFPASIDLSHGRPVDNTQNGKVEFMVQVTNAFHELSDRILGWDTALNKFVTVTVPGVTLLDGWSNFGDVDGDGRLDYLSLNSAAQVVLRRWSIGPGGPLGAALTSSFVAAPDCSSSMADVDGDGRAELLAFRAGLASATCDEKGWYALSFNGAGLTARPLFFDHASGRVSLAANSPHRRGDFNGDGLVETIWYDRVGWNTGAGLRLAAPQVNNAVGGYDNLAGDMNGDGRDDLVTLAPTGIWVSASYGDGTFATPVQIAASDGTAVVKPKLDYSTTKLGDFNADGRLDIVRIVDGHMSVLLQQANYFQDRLATVRDEGVPWARETITYANNWSDHMEKIFDSPACTYPLVCQRRGMPVVRRVSSRAHNAEVTTAADATSRDMHYSFEDPVRDLRGRGFLGFGTMRAWDVAQPRETVTTYAHRKQVDGKYYPEVGAASIVTIAVPIVTATRTQGTSTETARIIRTYYTHTTVRTHELNGRTTYTVQPTSSYTKEWEEPVTVRWGAGLGTTDPTEHVLAIAEPAEDAVLRVVRVDSQFDGYGNLTKNTQLTAVPGTEIPLVSEQIAMTYDNRLINAEHDGADWLIGLLTQRKVTRTDTAHGIKTVTRTTDFTNDERGRLQKVEVEKASVNPDVRETTTYGYDALGVQNRVITVAGDPAAPSLPTQETHFEYAPVFPGQPDERIYPSQIWQQHVPAAMRSSTWRATHPGYGVTVASVDANGVSTQSTFDAFGRPLSVQRDGQAKVTYRYAARPDTAGGINGMIVTTTSASITTQSFTDVLGRSLQSTRTGFDGTTHIVSKTRYDLFGRVYTSTAAAPAGTTTSAYDSLGRLVTTTLPDGKMVTYTHTFDTTTTVDPVGQQNILTFDVAGRTISSTDVD